jgi:hypothetical protein
MERSHPSSGRSATPADINRNGRPTSIGTGGRHQSECPADIIGMRTKPLVEALKTWIKTTLARLPGGATVAHALRYGLNHWDGLVRFLDDGRIEIDPNTVERTNGPIALTLFAGSDEGAQKLGDAGLADRDLQVVWRQSGSLPDRRTDQARQRMAQQPTAPS